MKLSEAWQEATKRNKMLRPTVNPPDGTPVYKVTIRPISYSGERGLVRGLLHNGNVLSMYDDFIDGAEVTDETF